jgi:carbamoyl-phosphate synthase large subunit
MAAAVQAVEALRRGDIGVRSLQEVHASLTASPKAGLTAGLTASVTRRP